MDSLNHSLTGDLDGDGTMAQRGRGRDSLFLMATVRLPGDKEARSVRVRNLSEGGLMIESDRIVPVGAVLTLTLRGIGDITGRVAWCAERRIGIALDQPIDPRRARKPVGTGPGTPAYSKPQLG